LPILTHFNSNKTKEWKFKCKCKWKCSNQLTV